jgi:hypothetical protein
MQIPDLAMHEQLPLITLQVRSCSLAFQSARSFPLHSATQPAARCAAVGVLYSALELAVDITNNKQAMGAQTAAVCAWKAMLLTIIHKRQTLLDERALRAISAACQSIVC